MLLQSHQSFDTVAEYDPKTGAFATFSRKAQPARMAAEPCRGVFDDLGGKLIRLYRLAGALTLDVDGRRTPMEDLAVELHPANGEHVLRGLAEGSVVFELKYAPPHLDPPLADDLTPFSEAEDFDFGLFLSNVSQDPDRQARMYVEP